MAVASLAVTKTYADGLAWTEARMDTAMQSIQTYTQTSLVNNFNQLRKDIWGATYSLDNDGNANLTNTFYKDAFGKSWTADAPKTNSLYNKQSASVRYLVRIDLGTGDVASPTLVSASLNLRLAPEATGKYLITMDFPVHINPVGGCQVFDKYMMVNKTSGATLIGQAVEINTGTEAVSARIPVSLSYIHNFSSTAAATFALYYVSTNGSAASINNHHIDANATNKVGYYAQIHKI